MTASRFSHLSFFSARLRVGWPLPFAVYDADGTLLLASGQVLASEAQRDALIERGATVDLDEIQAPLERIRHAARDELPALWTEHLIQLGDTLMHSEQPGFRSALEASTPNVMALVERDPDLAIFQVLRREGNLQVQYGVRHSLHAAIAAQLVARRLAWREEDTRLAFKATLTMNLGMLELHGQLAVQATPPTPEQRAAVLAHPTVSRRMLELAGVRDARWLEAVAQHHESPDGKGYPDGISHPSPLADLVRRADLYIAKLSSRTGRDALAADQAGRLMFMQEPSHPMTAALVKEFGVYPPGCWVRLVTGEVGVVVRRGPTVFSPVVAVLTQPNGQPLPAPMRRDTADPSAAIQGVLGARDPRPQPTTAQLMALALA